MISSYERNESPWNFLPCTVYKHTYKHARIQRQVCAYKRTHTHTSKYQMIILVCIFKCVRLYVCELSPCFVDFFLSHLPPLLSCLMPQCHHTHYHPLKICQHQWSEMCAWVCVCALLLCILSRTHINTQIWPRTRYNTQQFDWRVYVI